jgi:hypothetical protein
LRPSRADLVAAFFYSRALSTDNGDDELIAKFHLMPSSPNYPWTVFNTSNYLGDTEIRNVYPVDRSASLLPFPALGCNVTEQMKIGQPWESRMPGSSASNLLRLIDPYTPGPPPVSLKQDEADEADELDQVDPEGNIDGDGNASERNDRPSEKYPYKVIAARSMVTMIDKSPVYSLSKFRGKMRAIRRREVSALSLFANPQSAFHQMLTIAVSHLRSVAPRVYGHMRRAFERTPAEATSRIYSRLSGPTGMVWPERGMGRETPKMPDGGTPRICTSTTRRLGPEHTSKYQYMKAKVSTLLYVVCTGLQSSLPVSFSSSTPQMMGPTLLSTGRSPSRLSLRSKRRSYVILLRRARCLSCALLTCLACGHSRPRRTPPETQKTTTFSSATDTPFGHKEANGQRTHKTRQSS